MKKLLAVVLIALLALFVACSPATPAPPAPEQPEGEAQAVTQGNTPQAQTPTPTPEPLPPMVLRTLPEPGQEQPVDAPLEITFDQPMDRASVEKAFAIEPGASVDGAFDWVDDQTVHFAFKDGFKRNERYRVRVIESATGQSGLQMARPFELRFSTVGFLEVTSVQPADGAAEILPDSIVTVLFNRPVVPLNAIEDAAGLPHPLTFTPPVRGQGQWLNTSIYQFIPDGDGFQASTEYTARVAQGLTDALAQAALPDDYEWTFTTVTPRAITSLPANNDIYVSPTPVISVTFNQPMDHASVEKNLILRHAETNEIVPGKFAWVKGGLVQPPPVDDYGYYYEEPYGQGEGPAEVGVETVMFTPNKTLDFGIAYEIELPKGTKGSIGQAQTGDVFKSQFIVSPYPEIVRSYPADGDTQIDPWSSLEITFNAPINPQSVKVGQNLIIEPTVAVTQVYTYWWNSNTSLQLSFPVEPSSQYRVRLGPDIEGRYGQKLGQAASITWQTRAQSPSVYMHSPGRIATYNAYTDTLAFVNVSNVSRVNFGLYKLPKADFIRLNGGDWWQLWDSYNPQKENLIKEWSLDVKPKLNANVIYRVDLGQRSELGDRLPPGLYYFDASVSSDDIFSEAKGPDMQYNLPRERKMLVVSKNNITFKTTGAEGLAWVTDLVSGLPVKNVPITFSGFGYGQSQPVGLGGDKTATDGVAKTDYSSRRDPFETKFALAGDPDAGDEEFSAAVSEWADGIERWNFNNVSTEDYQQPYAAHFYSDRNIYRPGQTVNFKGVLRADDDATYSLPTAADTAQITVSDSQGKQIFTTDLPVSDFGTISGSFDLDASAALGFYSIEILYAEDQYFYDDFQVAAYRKPEFLVEVATDKPEYVQGDTIKVTAQAEFFSGGPVSNAAVNWTLLTDDYFFTYQGKGYYDFTDYDFSRLSMGPYYPGFGEQINQGQGQTDAEGRFTFEVPADVANRITSQRFTLDVVITDINNQVVAAQAAAIVHKGLVYVGLRPETYVGVVGRESRINVLAVDWDSQPVAKQEVQLVFSEHNWYSVQKQYDDGSYYWDSIVESIPVFTTTATTDAGGQAVAGFTPAKGGIYRVAAAAVDKARNTVHSSTFMWVSGQEYVNWRQENNDRLELVADQREYRVGDTATILIPHPYSGTVQALFTLERGHIYKHWVQELKTNSEQIKLPITEDMIPNMYLSVVVVKGVDDSTPLPSFKVGYASLPIATAEKELNIALTPNKSAEEKYQPGETAEYLVKVTNAQGQPVKAELSLALVDKAVLSLAPETPGQLLSTFWRTRGLGVQTGAGLSLAIDRINLTVAPEAKGGGGGFDEGFGVIRGDFKDTALWLADFETNANGEGVVKTKLPDNLTTWTLTGKGVTGADTLVGENAVEIVSTKPLLVRPLAPRFFVVGDEATMGMIVQNNTGQAQSVEARFEAEGLTVEPLVDGPVAIKSGERVKIEYRVVAQDVKQAKLTMGAKSGQYGDALTFDLPVYRFSTPETVATVGVLTEDGVRTEGVALPRSFDPTQGDLTVSIDPSLAAGMRDGLDYLEHFPYECTEQTVSRFLPNVVTYRAYQQLKLDNPRLAEKLPGLVSTGLQRLYSQQHIDGGWGWWVRDKSDPGLTAYVLLGLVEARHADFAVDDQVLQNGVDFLRASLKAPKDIKEPWQANRQAFILYVLAEAGSGDLGRSVALFKEREKLDLYGRAYLALAIHLLDEKADQIDTLLADLTSAAIVSATGAHWEEAQVDYYAMNTDTRSTAIIIAALSRLQPDNGLLPNAVRWLMTIRENGGHWETTQESAWAIIGLTDFMAATGELEGNYGWKVSLNGQALGDGTVSSDNIDETTKLRVEVADLLTDAVNRLAVERDPIGSEVKGSPGRLYYAAYLTYFKPVQEVKALDRGIIVSRQYTLADDETGQAITGAKVGDVIRVKLTLIAPNDLHYVVVEDPFPAGAEGVDTSLATTSAVGEAPELDRTDTRDPWGDGYGWWYFSHAELRDEKAVLFATYLPKGTYEYTYTVRASLPGQFRVIPTHAEEMYFPEVFGRGDGGLFKISQ